MNRLLCVLAACALAAPALAADVGVSVTMGQPGFYGRIDVGGVAPPRVLYREPVVISPAPGRVVRAPIYLRVPPGHAKNWRKFCGRYNACGQPVYFVQDSWYNDVYVPYYRRGHPVVQPAPVVELTPVDPGSADSADADQVLHGHGFGRGNGNGKGHRG